VLSASTFMVHPWNDNPALGWSTLAVADRDFICDLLYACALGFVHLSRFAEEVVIFTSQEFAFAQLDDTVALGSSIMPQKKNPQIAEHLRGRSGVAIGRLAAMGADAAHARLVISGEITQFVTQQALSQAFQDVFMLLAGLFVLALLIVPFAKVPKLTNELPPEMH